MTIQKILTKLEPKKENLLGAAKEINKEFGYVSAEAVDVLSDYFDMKPAEVYSAVSFYDHINVKPPASLTIRICDGANCSSKHSERIIEEIEQFFGLREGDDFNPKVRIERESCLGLCEVGPVMIVNGTVFERVETGRVGEILSGYV